MEILKLYNKDNISDVFYNDFNVVSLVDSFFSKMPNSYRIIYDKNMSDVEIFLVDDIYDKSILNYSSGLYYRDNNIILIKNIATLFHELMHLASNNRQGKSIHDLPFSTGLVEGLTEYLASIIRSSKPKGYYFETLTADMLCGVNNKFVKNYFDFNEQDFIGLFSSKIDMYNLLFSLNYYNEHYDTDYTFESMQKSIEMVIKSLLLMTKNSDYKLFAQKLMDLLNSSELKVELGYFYNDYLNYTNNLIKEDALILKR